MRVKLNKKEKGLAVSLVIYNFFGVMLLIVDIIRRFNGVYIYSAEYVILLALSFLTVNGNENGIKKILKNQLIRVSLIIALIISSIFIIELVFGWYPIFQISYKN